MANIPYKLYTFTEQSGAKQYQLLPGTNTPYGMTEVTNPQEAYDYLKELGTMGTYVPGSRTGPRFDVQGVARDLQATLQRYESTRGQTAVIDKWTNPRTGEVLTNIEPQTIKNIEAENAKIASGEYEVVGYAPSGVPLYGPSVKQPKTLGSPAPAGGVTEGNPAIKSRDLIIADMPITVPGVSGNMSYKIAKGDTLTSIAKKFGTTVDAIMKANNVPSYVSNPVLGGSDSSTVKSTEEARAADEAAKAKIEKDKADAIKKAQDDLAAASTEAARLAYQKQIQDLKTSLGIGTPPTTPTYESDYKALISSEGVTGLQTQINSINTEMNDLEAKYKVGKAAITNELAPMDILTTRQQQLADQYNQQLDSLNNRKKTLVDEYNLKVSNVNAIMDAKKMDYEAAKSAYDTKFNQAINFMTATNTLENTAIDNARANWTAITSNLKGVDYDSLPDSMKANISQLETQMGMPLGITRFTMDNMADEEEILANNIVKDENDNPVGYSVLYKDADGNIKTKFVGISGVSTGTGMGGFTNSDPYDTELIKYLTANPNVSPMKAVEDYLFDLKNTYTPTESERAKMINRAQYLADQILTLDEIKSKIDEGRKANISLSQMYTDIDNDWRVLNKQEAKDYARSIQTSPITAPQGTQTTSKLPQSFPSPWSPVSWFNSLWTK